MPKLVANVVNPERWRTPNQPLLCVDGDSNFAPVASRACITATRWAHAIGLHRIELQHSTTNDGSRQVAARSGFRHEGTRRGACLLIDGWHDMELCAHLSTDEA